MKPQRRQREEDDDESFSSSSPLQSSSTVTEFIAALQQIVARNDSSDRSEENVSIILTSKIQLIRDNRANQDLLNALGEFFMWVMPFTQSLTGAERETEHKQRERGRKICSRKDLEELFARHLLPCATSSDAIYSLCRTVCLVAFKPNNTYFVTTAARDELLKLVENAPCEKSLQWALKAIYFLAITEKDGDSIVSNPFVCDEVSTIAHKLFCESTVPQIVEVAADLLRIQVVNSTPQFCSADPDFAQKMLRKLDEATETETIASIANLIGEVLYKKQGNMQLFASGEAARVFLSKLNSTDDPEVLQQVCRGIGIAGMHLENFSGDFASPEMCRAIFKCLSKQKDEVSKEIIFRSIAVLTHIFPRTRSVFAQESPDLTQAIIETLTTATEDKTRLCVAVVVAVISMDAPSAKRLFNNLSLYEALIFAASRAHSEETKTQIVRAMHNATISCTDFLPLCAARFPFYDERQIELLKLDSLDSLVSDLNNKGWAFDAPVNADCLKLQSILIVLAKFAQFLEDLDQRIEKGDAEIEKMILTIARGFIIMVRTHLVCVLGDPFFDVTLSLLERSSGAANVVFVKIIYCIVKNDPNFTIYPSMVLLLLQKLDNSKELRDREFRGLKMELDIYEILEAAAIRSPELFRNNDFLVDNSALIRSCFERSIEIHRFDAIGKDRKKLKTCLQALYKVDPRMKETMEGWDRPVRKDG